MLLICYMKYVLMSYIDLHNNLGGQFQLRILHLLVVQHLGPLLTQPDHPEG